MKMSEGGELRENLDRLHTTELGAVRIKRNLSLDAALTTEDVICWCKAEIGSPDAVIERKGKNWYASAGNHTITVNAHSCTVITAHKVKDS